MKIRARFDQLLIDPLERRGVAGREWVMKGLLNRVGSISNRAVDMSHGVANRAGYPRMGRRIVHIVIFGIIKRARKERNRVVTARAPPGGFDIAIPLQPNLAGFTDACEIGGLLNELK